jgi:hypothetical protein
MSKIRKRLLGGEILEVPVGARFGYVQYLGEHREYGDTVLVNPALHERQAHFPARFFASGYVAFYPASDSVTQKIAEVVAQSSPPEVPKRFRRPGVTHKDGAVESWVIEGGWRHVVRETLSDDERSLPIAGVWTQKFLGEQIAKGWTPATDGR